MRTLKTGLCVGLMTAATAVLALPGFVADFEALYKPAEGSALKKAGCAVCHIGHGPKLNAYGEDIKKLTPKGSKKLTADILKKAESLDSDKDGVKNGAEIKAGSLPGDAKSKPGKK